MNRKPKTNTLILLGGAVLIAIGAMLLLGHFFGSFFMAIWNIITFVTSTFFALFIIAAGIILLVHAHRRNSPNGASSTSPKKKLYRSSSNKVLGGICGGLGAYFNINPLIIRIITVVCGVASFYLVIPLYVICWFIIPPDTRVFSTWT